MTIHRPCIGLFALPVLALAGGCPGDQAVCPPTQPAPLVTSEERADAVEQGNTIIVDSCPGGQALWVFPTYANSPPRCAPGEPITVSVPGVAGAKASSCQVSDGAKVFSLAFDGNTPGKGVIARVKVDPAKVFGADRAALLTAFRGFRQALFQQQTTAGQECLLPGASELLTARVAETIPLPVTEVLTYRYGVSTGAANRVELRPGMQLSVQGSTFVKQVNDFTQDEWAFHASGTQTLQVGATRLSADPTRAPLVTLSPLIGAMGLNIDGPSRSANVTWPMANIRYAANVLDLSVAVEQRSYLAVSYPSANQATPGVNVGNASPTANTVIVRADNPEELAALLDAISQNPELGCQNAQSRCALWVGRGALIPEIRVTIDGAATWVPLGTTVREMLLQTTDWSTPGTAPSRERVNGLLVRETSNLNSDRANVSVVFPIADGAPKPNAEASLAATAFDLPLVQGDQLFIQTINSL